MLVVAGVMRILLGNSVSVAAGEQMVLQSAVPFEFEETAPLGFSVPPPNSTTEPVVTMATGSLLPLASGESHLSAQVVTAAFNAPSTGEFNERAGSDWNDFLAPADGHALSDWPL
jgi:hypothetical protein